MLKNLILTTLITSMLGNNVSYNTVNISKTLNYSPSTVSYLEYENDNYLVWNQKETVNETIIMSQTLNISSTLMVNYQIYSLEFTYNTNDSVESYILSQQMIITKYEIDKQYFTINKINDTYKYGNFRWNFGNYQPDYVALEYTTNLIIGQNNNVESLFNRTLQTQNQFYEIETDGMAISYDYQANVIQSYNAQTDQTNQPYYWYVQNNQGTSYFGNKNIESNIFYTVTEITATAYPFSQGTNYQSDYGQYTPQRQWIDLEYKYPTQFTVTQEVIDIPDVMFSILGMPFSFISTAFNLTIFSGTAYELNFGNAIFFIISLLILMFLVKIIIKMRG